VNVPAVIGPAFGDGDHVGALHVVSQHVAGQGQLGFRGTGGVAVVEALGTSSTMLTTMVLVTTLPSESVA
jgi:hypothetical protein